MRLFVSICAFAVLVCAPARAADELGPPPTPVEPPATIAAGVRIGTVDVAGLTAEAAAELVRSEFALPLVLSYGPYVFRASPGALAVPAIPKAVQQAQAAQPNAVVPLEVTVRRAAVKSYVGAIARRFARRAIDARVFLRNLKPAIAREKPGREIDRILAERAVTDALRQGTRGPLALKPRVLQPKVRRSSIGPVIVIHRGSNKLYFYNGTRLLRTFGVATGERRYPTPIGRFRVIVRWKNPWWYPPDSDWAKGQDPIPPGPSNPLGTRWMGISSPGVGIHGTPNPGSIGYSVSHGCIRMRIPDAEWLFERVTVGTTVFIVRA